MHWNVRHLIWAAQPIYENANFIRSAPQYHPISHPIRTMALSLSEFYGEFYFAKTLLSAGTCECFDSIYRWSVDQHAVWQFTETTVYPIFRVEWRVWGNKSDEEIKWNESGFRPPLCTYRLNWARRTSWGWRDDWDDTVLQTQDSKFEPWRSEAEHATSRSRRLPTILTFTRGWGRNNFVSFKPPRPGTEPRTLAWKAAVLTTTLGPPPSQMKKTFQREMMW